MVTNNSPGPLLLLVVVVPAGGLLLLPGRPSLTAGLLRPLITVLGLRFAAALSSSLLWTILLWHDSNIVLGNSQDTTLISCRGREMSKQKQTNKIN